MNGALRIIAAAAVTGGLAGLVMGHVAAILPLLVGLAALAFPGTRR